ncbi:hypothetical protein Tco_0429220, partial [Tanacetum coccineum]
TSLLYGSVINGPFKYGTVTEPKTPTTPATFRDRHYEELTNAEKIHEACDIKATNTVPQGLPQDIYKLERESKLYDEFDTFTSVHGETIHSYYLRFAQMINDMHMIGITMKPIQVNTKFVNHLQAEWSKFVTDVKLAKDLHNMNFDYMYAYLRQHEAHANEAPVANHSSVVHHQSYQAPVIQQPPQASFPQIDSGLVVLSFLPSDDLISSLNKAMAFVNTSLASRYPPTNNQLRTSFNPRN